MPWIKCSDMMPEIGQVCIVHHRNNPLFDGSPGHRVVSYGVTIGVTNANRHNKNDPYYEEQWFEGLRYIDDECHESERIYVTEWMPLPDPPVSESGPVANPRVDRAGEAGSVSNELLGADHLPERRP